MESFLQAKDCYYKRQTAPFLQVSLLLKCHLQKCALNSIGLNHQLIILAETSGKRVKDTLLNSIFLKYLLFLFKRYSPLDPLAYPRMGRRGQLPPIRGENQHGKGRDCAKLATWKSHKANVNHPNPNTMGCFERFDVLKCHGIRDE